MKVSASIFSSGHRSIEDLILELDRSGVDLFHIDWNENRSISEQIHYLKTLSKTPLDVHLIQSNPLSILKELEALDTSHCCLQYETLNEEIRLKAFSTQKNSVTNAGVALTMSTPSDSITEIEDLVDFIMLMTTTPGVSGGKFTAQCFQKIIELKNLFPTKKIHVDGGVTDEVSYILKLIGVDILISGSFLTGQESLLKGIVGLHKPTINSETPFLVSDFMTPLKYLPCLLENSEPVSILQIIEKFGLGFALITNESGELHGVVSNADIRRSYLKSLQNQSLIHSNLLINKNPFTIHEKKSVFELHDFVNNLNRIILFLPITDSNGILKGAILLNNLTKA